VFLLDVFWWERAIWLLVNACVRKIDLASYPSGVSDGMEMGSAHSRPLRTESTYHQMQYHLRTNCPPCYGRGCGVRLVMDSTLPVGGSV
jgi:hypothetical protein